MTELTGVNADQERYRNERASTWIDAQDVFDGLSAPLGRMAMERLALTAGQRVLDIGCGTGATSLELADRVAPGGQVTGVDISEPLLHHARTLAAGRGDIAFEDIDGVEHADHVEFAEDRLAELARSSTGLGVIAEMPENDDDATRAGVAEAIQAALQERVAEGVPRLARAVLLVRATA